MQKILVATNGGLAARKAVRLGVELAAAARADLIFVRVVEGVGDSPLRLDSGSDRALAEASSAAWAKNVPHETVLIAGEIAPTIASCAETFGADLVVAGESRRRLLPFASVPRRLMALAPCGILTAPRVAGLKPSLRQVCAVVDDSPESERAVELGVDLAGAAGARITFLSLVGLRDTRVSVDRYGPLGLGREHALTPGFMDVSLNRAVARAEKRGVPAEGRVIASSSPGDEIVSFARRARPDFLFLGVKSRGVGRLRLVERALRSGRCPVVAVPARRPERGSKRLRERAAAPLAGLERSLKARIAS